MNRRKGDAINPTADRVETKRGESPLSAFRLDGRPLTLTPRQLRDIRERETLDFTEAALHFTTPETIRRIREGEIFSAVPPDLPLLGLDDVRTEGIEIHERWVMERRKDSR